MLTETFGGVCHICGYDRMLMRYGSGGYYQYDACPDCGFAYATNNHDIEQHDEEVWKTILNMDGDYLEQEGFERSRSGYKHFLDNHVLIPKNPTTSVFNYDKKTEDKK